MVLCFGWGCCLGIRNDYLSQPGNPVRREWEWIISPVLRNEGKGQEVGRLICPAVVPVKLSNRLRIGENQAKLVGKSHSFRLEDMPDHLLNPASINFSPEFIVNQNLNVSRHGSASIITGHSIRFNECSRITRMTITPLRKQYLRVKQKYPEAIVFFSAGGLLGDLRGGCQGGLPGR